MKKIELYVVFYKQLEPHSPAQSEQKHIDNTTLYKVFDINVQALVKCVPVARTCYPLP